MTANFVPKLKIQSQTFDKFIAPLLRLLPFAPQLLSRGDRPSKMTFEDQLKALVYFHLQEHKSARHLIQDMKESDFAKQNIAPDGGISRSSFSEAINHRGLEQLQFLFENLYQQAATVLPKEHKELGNLVSIDGSLIDAVLSMYWADYRKGSKKAKAHCGFNINSGIPSKIFFTDGNGGERPFVDQILAVEQTGVMDRGYQYYVATDRHDLTAEQIATIYKLRWSVESFFKWWKEHLKVYHLIARSEYCLMVQIFGGLITYLLMAIYCHEEFNEKVSIKRVRQLRIKILNELFNGQDDSGCTDDNDSKEQRKSSDAKT